VREPEFEVRTHHLYMIATAALGILMVPAGARIHGGDEDKRITIDPGLQSLK
jgi:hypothetical protein